MKCWLTEDDRNRSFFILWVDKPYWEKSEGFDGFLSKRGLFADRLKEDAIRSMGCTKKLPTGKQVIAVNLEMR